MQEHWGELDGKRAPTRSIPPGGAPPRGQVDRPRLAGFPVVASTIDDAPAMSP